MQIRDSLAVFPVADRDLRKVQFVCDGLLRHSGGQPPVPEQDTSERDGHGSFRYSDGEGWAQAFSPER